MVVSKQAQSFTDDQKDKVREFVELLKDGADHPEDVLDSWEGMPDRDNLEFVEGSSREVFVDPEDVVGTDSLNVDRFRKSRLMKICRLILEDDYSLKPDNPPVLNKIEGKYYVGSDGNHRSMVFKFIGAERMYAEVKDYNVSRSCIVPHVRAGETRGESGKVLPDLQGKLVDSGLSEDEAGSLYNMMRVADRAMEGDAVAQSKIRRVENDSDSIQGLISLVEKSDLDWGENDFTSPVSLKSVLDNMREDLMDDEV